MTKFTNTIGDILSTMDDIGGSFVKQLAVLYRLADDDNRAVLEMGFHKYFQKYDEITTLWKTKALLLAALKGVVRVADRKTAEFDTARAVIAKAEARDVR